MYLLLILGKLDVLANKSVFSISLPSPAVDDKSDELEQQIPRFQEYQIDTTGVPMTQAGPIGPITEHAPVTPYPSIPSNLGGVGGREMMRGLGGVCRGSHRPHRAPRLWR